MLMCNWKSFYDGRINLAIDQRLVVWKFHERAANSRFLLERVYNFFECLVSRILQACDRLRDDNLPELGVKLEDVEGTKFCFLPFAMENSVISLHFFSASPH